MKPVAGVASFRQVQSLIQLGADAVCCAPASGRCLGLFGAAAAAAETGGLRAAAEARA